MKLTRFRAWLQAYSRYWLTLNDWQRCWRTLAGLLVIYGVAFLLTGLGFLLQSLIHRLRP